MKRILAAVATLDRADGLICLGLVLVAAGLWAVYPPAAPITVGLVLLGFGLKSVS